MGVDFVDRKLNFMYNKDVSMQIKKRLEQSIFARQEHNSLHNSFELSEQLYAIIKEGNLEMFEKAMQIEFNCNPGILAKDELRSIKNFLICICSNVVCYLLEHKLLEVEIAYSISDICIQMIEETTDGFMAYQTLIAGMIEFIEQRKLQTKKQYHHLIKAADAYIFKNLHEKIVITEMAHTIGTNPSYLSQVFKKYLGITIQQYIMEEKVARGKNLLRYSHYSLQEISQYLGFSSQSQFGKELKKREGFSPKSYREKYQISEVRKRIDNIK